MAKLRNHPEDSGWTGERWREMARLFEEALVRQATDRDSFLTATASVALAKGSRLGAYEIESLVGMGGMGVVYRARDLKLQRDVALKVLLPSIADDPERIARFKREAQLLASLNNPHIAQAYGLEEAGGMSALILEFVEGPTLADRIGGRALPVSEALAIAKQIAIALEAAHEQHIIHRDLKPANVKVRRDGTVKVLDFGLARAAALPDHVTPSVTSSSAAVHSRPGIAMGTPPYMSPEQVRGETVDRRADLWAFGCTLFEMLTGRRLFGENTVADTMSAVLTREPDWNELPATTPQAIRTLLRRCLEKETGRRIDSAAVARLEIDDVGRLESRQAVTRTRRWPSVVVAAVLLLAAVAAGLTAKGFRPFATDADRVSRLAINTPADLALAVQGTDRDLAIDPDWAFVVYRAGIRGQLVLRRFDQLDVSPLPGITNARGPFISPDGRWIGFIENNTTLKKVPVVGGLPVTLAHLPGSPRGAAWIDDSSLIVATNTTGLLRVPANGGEPTELTMLDRTRGELGHWFPSALPGRAGLLFTIAAADGGASQVGLLDLATNERTTVLHAGSDARYVDTGHLIFAAAGNVSGVAFDLARRTVVGEPATLIEGVSVSSAGALNAAVAPSGTLVYVPQPTATVTRTLVWIDRQGRETAIPAPARGYVSPRISPDGSRVALETRDPEPNIWTWDLERQTLARLTFGMGIAPVWTPDGLRIVFASRAPVGLNLFVRAADGTGSELRLADSANIQMPSSVTPDGTEVVAIERRTRTGSDIVRRPFGAKSDSPSASLVETASTEQNADVSPDGRFIAYESDESGRFEIYVRPYPDVANGRWQASSGGGTQPAWTRDGRELLYLNGANRLTAVRVETKGSFRVGVAATIAVKAYSTPVAWRGYDVAPDNRRFLMLKEGMDATPSPSLIVVQNWFTDLKSRMRE